MLVLILPADALSVVIPIWLRFLKTAAPASELVIILLSLFLISLSIDSLCREPSTASSLSTFVISSLYESTTSEIAEARDSLSLSTVRVTAEPSVRPFKSIVTPLILEISLPIVLEVAVNEVPLILNSALEPSVCESTLSLVDLSVPSAFHSDCVNPRISVKLLVPASILIRAAPVVLDFITS